MKRAIFIAGAGAVPPVALCREFLTVPLDAGLPGSLDGWTELARDRDVELAASWLVLAPPAATLELPPRARGALRGVREVTRLSALARVVAEIDEAAGRSRVIADRAAAARRCREWRRRGKRIAFTNGVFDLFHLGHLRLLAAARRLADVLVVGVNSDESARRLKGRSRPLLSQWARAEQVACVRGVDLCVIFEEPDPRELLRAVRPDVLAKGSEYTLGRVVGRRLVEGWGGRVVLLPHLEGWSSTEVLERLLSSQGKSVP
jgi:rfaE bifunctional protein nucleotidyltransferase chain/domain